MTTFLVPPVEPTGTKPDVTGNLNLHGVTQSISFPADIQVAADTVTPKTGFATNRRDFNISFLGKPAPGGV